MSDTVRRILEQQEAARRALNTLPDPYTTAGSLSEAYKHLSVGRDVMLYLRQEEERRKLLSSVIDDYRRTGLDAGAMMRMAEEADRHRKLLEGPIEEARRLGLLDPQSDLRRAMASAVEAHTAYEQLFRRPGHDEIERLARESLGVGTLAATVFGAQRNGAALSAAMSAMHSPWLNVQDLGRSAHAFAEIQAMGQLLNQHRPYEADLATLLRPNLGDWRDPVVFSSELLVDPLHRSRLYLERGFNPALSEFTVPAFEESIEIAGLRERREDHNATADDSDEDRFARAREAFDCLQKFEVAVRRFIDRVMRDAFGENWMKHRLPNNMLDDWRNRRDTAVKAGEVEQALIDYADFTDYRSIIERKDNWNQVFKPIFGRSEDVRESFQRLFPIRIATMHARIVTLDDEMLLLVETRRVLSAIQKAK